MVVQRTLTPPVGVRSSHPQPQPQQANLLRFYYRGVAQMVARLVRDQEAVGSNPVTPTKKVHDDSQRSRFIVDFFVLSLAIAADCLVGFALNCSD